MKPQRFKAAFTLIELAVVIATITLLLVMILPALATTGTKSQRIICVNNLKDTYLAFKIWAGENSDQFPMAVSTALGGGKEYVYSYAEQFPFSYEPWAVFQVCSNQLVTPKVLYCPSDNNPNPAISVIGGPTTHIGTYAPSFGSGFDDGYISYLICGDATLNYPGAILFGDRNIGSQGTIANNPTPAAVMFPDTHEINSGFTAESTWAWSAHDQHLGAGNLALTDGSVAQVTVNGLRQAMIMSTNALPGFDAIGTYYNFP
ncbi:MAG TPA: type II secretion system protein [Verrucomicrobiae bacterium]|jgi:type II secretory pathway pseudopilin PulG